MNDDNLFTIANFDVLEFIKKYLSLEELELRSAILYGSETRCLRENEMAILRRTKTAMVRAMCGAKKRTEDQMEMLSLKETVVHMAKANGVRWYGHVVRRV